MLPDHQPLGCAAAYLRPRLMRQIPPFRCHEHCFVFNPTDDAGQTDVRKTSRFTIVKLAPTAMDECKDGGWQEFGTGYANQGQSVAAVQSSEASSHHEGGRPRARDGWPGLPGHPSGSWLGLRPSPHGLMATRTAWRGLAVPV
jgi:hypothetical protein